MKKLLSLLLILTLLLSACKGSSMANDNLSSNADKSESFTENDSGGWSEKPSEPSLDADSSLKHEVSGTLSENDLANRKLIKTAYLTLETKEFDSLKTSLEALIPSYGGYIQDSNFYAPQYSGSHRNYSLTVRIPVDNLDAFLTEVGELGTVTNASEKMDDVTESYIDMTAYKEALQVEYNKIMELLEKAVDLEQILLLESKLSELRYEINSYESKLRAYDNLIAYSTVHITVNEVEFETPVEDSIWTRISTGFMQSLYSIRDFCVELLVFVLANLPILILLAIALILLSIIWKKRRRRAPRQSRTPFQQNRAADADVPAAQNDSSDT